MQRLLILATYFKAPLIILLAMISYGFGLWLHFSALPFIFIAIAVGTYGLIKEMLESLAKKQYALDYIAFLAISVALFTGEFFVAAVISLMLSTGKTLEDYGIARAKLSLSALINRIPQTVLLAKQNQPGESINIARVKKGERLFIRKGEVIPLDGTLSSAQGYIDESSLTGEPYPVEKITEDTIRSGTINTGEAIVLTVTREEKDSTYKKIVALVKKAQEEKSPFIRIADKYSTYFTFLTLTIAAFAYFLSRDINSVLAVLVIATPCPLIIATPIALLGGVNKAAKQRIIIKKLASLEVLSRLDTLVFDKTGTLTLGRPTLTQITLHEKSLTKEQALTIAQALERNSLHPIAKTIVNAAKEKGIAAAPATHIEEKIGSGISGVIKDIRYALSKVPTETQTGMAIGLFQKKKLLATFHLEDKIKQESKKTLEALADSNLDLHIFTGDKKIVAEDIASKLGQQVTIQAGLTPEGKLNGIEALKKQHRIIGMVGDGINDAPALAKADVGLVFSNEEQTAASEAADVILLGGEFHSVRETIHVAKRSIRIAKQSIFWGIGLSTFCMILAAFGYIPPILGAGIQEAIDIAVIINALRASR